LKCLGYQCSPFKQVFLRLRLTKYRLQAFGNSLAVRLNAKRQEKIASMCRALTHFLAEKISSQCVRERERNETRESFLFASWKQPKLVTPKYWPHNARAPFSWLVILLSSLPNCLPQVYYHMHACGGRMPFLPSADYLQSSLPKALKPLFAPSYPPPPSRLY
jgi:hypothetical protein